MKGAITYLQFKKSMFTLSISIFIPETKYLIWLYLLVITAGYIAENSYSMLMLKLEKHYKALGKDKLSYYRNVLYTGYIHWQKDVPSHNSSTTKIKSSKLAIRILFVTIVIRIYVLVWSCKKDRNLGGLWQKDGKNFFIKIDMDYQT